MDTQHTDTPTTHSPPVLATPQAVTPTHLHELQKPVPNHVLMEICEQVELTGKSLSVICTDFGIDSSIVYKRAQKEPAIAEALAHMRQQRAHALADKLTDALDTVQANMDPDNPRKNDIAIRYTDMRLRHVQWLIERTNPEYSNKQEIRVGPADTAAAIEEAWRRRALAQSDNGPINPTIQDDTHKALPPT